jgi:RNA polymerase sigma factor (sigma-70 family)
VRTKAPFEEVVDQFGSMVLRACRALVGPVDADDAWSETFLSALRAYPELPADAKLEAWLITIAQRKAIDALRSRSRRAVPMAELPERAPGAGIEGRDLDLHRALSSLPEKQRLAVVCHHLCGLPYAEVAALIGGSPDAARRAAADGIAKLREVEGGLG